MAKTTKKTQKRIETLTHEADSRKNIPTAEYESVMEADDRNPMTVAYERRDPDLDPQLVWRGKDVQDWSDLVVPAPPLFIQEKVHPKVLVDDLARASKVATPTTYEQTDLFADFDGVLDDVSRTEFYEHEANWANRMILGDSLQVMASLAEREGLRGKVQCIYFDPPYGIKFNSNFQWSTTSRDVKDGRVDHITREPEQVKAFRDTWREGIHSYLTYLRDRLTVARDLLHESGSVFVQIGDENVHRLRAVMDEVFGDGNFVSLITLTKAASQSTGLLASVNDYILWFAKDVSRIKYRQLYRERPPIDSPTHRYICVEEPDGTIHDLSLKQKLGEEPIPDGEYLRMVTLTSQTGSESSRFQFPFEGDSYKPPGARGWSTGQEGLIRVMRAGRMWAVGKTLMWKNYHADYPFRPRVSLWDDIRASGFGAEKIYVVQTQPEAVQRCLLMATDPGDLVLDPTCGSGTTATVSEQWGRRWITVDTSRVALALARARVMGARYPYYVLADAKDGGQAQSPSTDRSAASSPSVHGNVRLGFLYERVPHVTLKAIANNVEIDVICEAWEDRLEELRVSLNDALGEALDVWRIPRKPDKEWSTAAQECHAAYWEALAERQREIDGSIAGQADYELLYDRPVDDKSVVRVAGPFTVESLSPHRTVTFDEHDQMVDPLASVSGEAAVGSATGDFGSMVLENLSAAGVQQAHKEGKLDFVSVSPWPGKMVCGEGLYREGSKENAPERRAAIFVGPEFGTVSRADLVEAAKEAGDAGFDVLVACAFNYEAHASEFDKLGRIRVLKARMNADLHMADDLKNTGKGNLFVIFGEPDIELHAAADDQVQVRVNGVDVFDPSTGEVRSDDADGIACWFVDTDYNEESFFVRQAYFLGANDPYKALKTTLKAEIDQDAWESLHSDTSRPFDKPASGRIAVKVINHLGDEVMKVLRVD